MENLSELVTIYPNVKILHFDVDIKNNRLEFKVVFLLFFHSMHFIRVYFAESLAFSPSFNWRMGRDMFHTMAFY